MMTEDIALLRRMGFGAILFVIVYFVFEACFISVISLGAGLDDAELISNLSFWNWGYGGSQPPLYTWIAYSLTQVFGLHFPLLQFLKFAVLCSTFLATYTGLRLLNVRPLVAACAMLSIFLLPQISWESQRALVHSVMGTAGSAWCFAAFAFFMKKRSFLTAVMLGLAIAAAILGKYNAGLFVLALFLAALALPETRLSLKTGQFVLSLIVAVLAMAPALLFMILHPQGVVERASKFSVGISGNLFRDRLAGLLDLTIAGLGFVSVALGMAFILMLAVRHGRKADGSGTCLAERFLAAVLITGLALVVMAVLVSGATNIKDRWLQPVLFLAPVYFTLVLARLDSSLRACKAFGFAGLIAALLVPGALYLNIRVGVAKGHRSEQNLDYPALQQVLKREGPVATILSPTPFIAGNLRLLDPAIKTLFAETPFASKRLARPLVVLWTKAETMPARLHDILAEAGIAAHNPVRSVDLAYRGTEGAVKKVYYLYIP